MIFYQFSSKLTSNCIWLVILRYKSIQISDNFQNKSTCRCLISGRSRISQMGSPTPKYYLAKNFPKTAWKWKKLDWGGMHPSPLGSANDHKVITRNYAKKAVKNWPIDYYGEPNLLVCRTREILLVFPLGVTVLR